MDFLQRVLPIKKRASTTFNLGRELLETLDFKVIRLLLSLKQG